MELRTVKSSLIAILLSLGLGAQAQTENVTSLGTMDINLQKAIEIALEENPTIRVADKDVELKKLADTEAWQNLLPQLSANLALNHSIKVAAIKTQMGEFKMGMDGSTTATGALTLTLPIFAPAIYQNMKLTKEDILVAQEAARGSRLDLVNQVTKAYFGALLAKDSYEVVKKSYDLTRDSYNLISSRHAVGKASEYDLISAEVQMRSMQSTMVSTETGLNLALLQLKVLMGITQDMGINIVDNLRNYEKDLVVEDQYSLALELDNGNTNLRQLDYNTKLLERTQKILRTNFMPTLAAQASYQYQSYSNPDWNFFKYHYSPSSSLAISLSIPIFTASNWTKIKSNKLQLAKLQDTRENTVRQLRMATESYRRNMISTIDQVESNSKAVEQAEKAVSISQARYDVGMGTVLELNQSETALTQAELTYNQSIYDFLKNKADLDYTLGRETYITK